MGETQSRPPALREAPGPDAAEAMRSLARMQAHPFAERQWYADTYGDIACARVGPYRAYLLFHPDYVRHVLDTNAKNYDRNTHSYSAAKSYLGKGLLTTNGAEWSRRRRTLNPLFDRNSVRGFVADMASVARDLIREWEPHAGTATFVDVHAAFMEATLQVISRSLLGTSIPKDECRRLREAISTVLHEAPRDTLLRFSTAQRREDASERFDTFLAAKAEVDRIVSEIIAQRSHGERRHAPILEALAGATPDTETTSPAEAVLDEVKTMLLSGHETTATALTFTAHLLSRHPAAADRVEAEARAALDGGPWDFSKVGRLEYTNAVLQEVLRLYPPIWQIERRALADDAVGGYRILQGSTVILSPWVTHRLPQYWPEPERFVPERFLESRGARPRYAHFPFGGGQHKCIGSTLAQTEAKLFMAELCMHFRFGPGPVDEPELEGLLTLRPKGGLHMPIRLRG